MNCYSQKGIIMKYVYAIIATIAFAIGFFVLTFVSTVPRSEFNDQLRRETCIFQGTNIVENVCTFRPNRNSFRSERLPCFRGEWELSYVSDDGQIINGTIQVTDENFARLDTEEELQEATGDIRPGDSIECYIDSQMMISAPLALAGFIAGSVILGVAMCCACCCSCWLILVDTDFASDAIDKLEEWVNKLFASGSNRTSEERRPQEENVEV